MLQAQLFFLKTAKDFPLNTWKNSTYALTPAADKIGMYSGRSKCRAE